MDSIRRIRFANYGFAPILDYRMRLRNALMRQNYAALGEVSLATDRTLYALFMSEPNSESELNVWQLVDRISADIGEYTVTLKWTR